MHGMHTRYVSTSLLFQHKPPPQNHVSIHHRILHVAMDPGVIFAEGGWVTGFDELDCIAMEVWEEVPSQTQCDGTAGRLSAMERLADGTKRSQKQVNKTLRLWMENLKKPYPAHGEKRRMAIVTGLSVVQIETFCGNYRKRYCRVGGKMVSYKQHAV